LTLAGLVNITALFPIMNATDNLAAVADLIESRPKTRNSHTASLLTLCRAAVESAAKTIWLLYEPDERSNVHVVSDSPTQSWSLNGASMPSSADGSKPSRTVTATPTTRSF
jgi:hypothetical protein